MDTSSDFELSDISMTSIPLGEIEDLEAESMGKTDIGYLHPPSCPIILTACNKIAWRKEVLATVGY